MKRPKRISVGTAVYISPPPKYEEHLDKVEAVIKPFRELLKADGIMLVIETLPDGTVEIYGKRKF